MTNILVIDDEQSIRQVLKIHLKGAGYEVITAEHAAGGLELVSKDIDLVICDYQLPDMTGLDLVKIIRTEFEKIPVLMISGFLDEWLASDVTGSGASELLRKPFHKDDLLLTVERILATAKEAI